MHHGYGILDKSIDQMNKKDREDFRKFVDSNLSFNPHIMVISKKKFWIIGLKIYLIGYLSVKKFLD